MTLLHMFFLNKTLSNKKKRRKEYIRKKHLKFYEVAWFVQQRELIQKTNQLFRLQQIFSSIVVLFIVDTNFLFISFG